MKKYILYIAFFLVNSFLIAQTTKFNLDSYSSFLSNNKNMTYQQLTGMYDAGKFLRKIPSFPDKVKYLDSVEIKYSMTEYEKKLLSQNGFAVTERPLKTNMRSALLDIWHKDLPLFISTDLILNAFHESYDAILKGVEVDFLIPKLELLLNTLHSKLSELEKQYGNNPGIFISIKDVDLYLTVARKLLNQNAQPYFPDNLQLLNEIISYTDGATIVSKPLFSTAPRKVDYSQFKPRGHYTDEHYPQLAKYFKAMMWLGRIELYLIKPVDADQLPSDQDISRQIIDSYLISFLIQLSNSQSIYDEMEKVIKSFVGEQDNVSLEQLRTVFVASKIEKCEDLLDTRNIQKFQDTLATKPFSEQKILSQLLCSNPMSPEKIKPASAFLLFGQRFVIDSYVTGSVVYDRIENKVTRMLPSTLDILFALGNSASAQLLEDEIIKFKYATNLAGLRYLIDSYGNDFWENSIYNLWLNGIRTLNAPNDRSNLPAFMQTAGWWQHKMNSQLSSWAELRHDNLLYAKQSYTGMIICSFPYGYVEPVPNFYSSMKKLAGSSIEKFSALSINLKRQIDYMKNFSAIMDTLASIAQKELSNESLNEGEKKFLRTVLYEHNMCGNELDGWYVDRLIYNAYDGGGNYGKLIVADYHTAPTDEFGNIIGWVKHAGTGLPNLCVLVANLAGVGDVAFVGPVSSYYEYTTTNFFRITDEEWRLSYYTKSQRPAWVNSYLADKNGNTLGAGINLVTSVNEEPSLHSNEHNYKLVVQNYPNPFNPTTIIGFNVPVDASNNLAEINIYDVNGELVKKLLSKELPSGNYLTRWDGSNAGNIPVSSGIYFYRVIVGKYSSTGKMNLIR